MQIIVFNVWAISLLFLIPVFMILTAVIYFIKDKRDKH